MLKKNFMYKIINVDTIFKASYNKNEYIDKFSHCKFTISNFLISNLQF